MTTDDLSNFVVYQSAVSHADSKEVLVFVSVSDDPEIENQKELIMQYKRIRMQTAIDILITRNSYTFAYLVAAKLIDRFGGMVYLCESADRFDIELAKACGVELFTTDH